MARHRSISTEISIDKALNHVSDQAALLYTWMIPHAGDDTVITGDPEELGMLVAPGRRWSVEQISGFLEEMVGEELIEWDREAQRIWFPCESFYRHQTYISKEKRAAALMAEEERRAARNGEKPRETPKKAASPSPSLTPTKDTPLPPSAADEGGVPAVSAPKRRGRRRETAPEVYSPEFEAAWESYPNKLDKVTAFAAWEARIKAGGKIEDMTIASRNFGRLCEQQETEQRYIMRGATFWGPAWKYRDYVKPPGTGNGRSGTPLCKCGGRLTVSPEEGLHCSVCGKRAPVKT